MSELINMASHSNAKWQLLASVSVLTLIAGLPQAAVASDDRPTVWIEIGAQLDRLSDGQGSFAPPFVSTILENPFTDPGKVQRPPRYEFGQEGRLSFAPQGSEWVFSAAVRYGRANSSHTSHEETSPSSARIIYDNPYYGFHSTFLQPAQAKRFATTTSLTHSSHLVMDFQAGRDVGLGVFGKSGSSAINAGVRVAQFTSKSKTEIDSDPDFTKAYQTIVLGPNQSGYFKIPRQHWDLYDGQMTMARSFRGIGPSLGWDGEATLVGKPDTGSVTFDWGLNGALLFGRQKVKGTVHTSKHYRSGHHFSGALPTVYSTSRDIIRSRSVVVPNAGGFAGFSLRFPNAKVSLGYRVDAFFGAIDGGVDARKTYDRDFYGPFATISIGIGG